MHKYKKTTHLRLARRKAEKKIRRQKILLQRQKGWLTYLEIVRKNCVRKGIPFEIRVDHQKWRNIAYFKRLERERCDKERRQGPVPLGETIEFLANTDNGFLLTYQAGICSTLTVPQIFSLSENNQESYELIRSLFSLLYYQTHTQIIIDYQACERIDVDASVCLDIIVAEFINYYARCRRRKEKVGVESIKPINFRKANVAKVLFSVGSFRTLLHTEIRFEDVIPFHLRIGDKRKKDCFKIREVHITMMVDYIITCLDRMKHNLTAAAEKDLYTVIGEIIINAEEHSSTNRRYAVGYFQLDPESKETLGTFNLTIMNFGKTIYQVFKDPACANKEVVGQMNDLSAQYTQKTFFKAAAFEEESLWTLYALQQGVTSTSKEAWKRGNGSVSFIESFFNLKGNDLQDHFSRLTVVSGRTHIIFDGRYRIQKRVRGSQQKLYKMMTFNDSGNIEDKPDEKYVMFTKNFFPGTIISARIAIKQNNIEYVNPMNPSAVFQDPLPEPDPQALHQTVVSAY